MTARKPTRRGGRVREWGEVPANIQSLVMFELRSVRYLIAGGTIYPQCAAEMDRALMLAARALRAAARKPPKVSQRVLDHFKDWTPAMVDAFNRAEVKLGKSAAKQPPRGMGRK